MLFAGVFVLGEVLTLLHMVVLAGVLAAAAAGCLCLNAKRNKSRGIMLLLLFFVAGVLRTGCVMGQTEQVEGLGLSGVSAGVTGNVASIQEKENRTALVLEECRLDKGAAECEPFRLQVYVPKEQGDVKIGMLLRVYGEFRAMDSARNPGQWDERIYYLGQRICYRMFAERTEVLNGDCHLIGDALYRLRRYFCRVLESAAKPEDAGLFEAVLLGERQNLDSETYSLYQRNGISHLLAISGLHLTLIGAALYRILRKLGCSFCFSAAVGGLFVCGYALMAGGSVSAKRASLMLILGFLAACPGRTYDMLSGIGFAALAVLWENPFQLMQSGFQFSFAAVLGIGGVYPALEGRFPESPAAVRALLAGISVQTVMLPVLLYHDFAFSPYSLFLNMAAVPLMTYVVLSGVLGLGFGMFSLTAARIALGTGHLIIWFYERMCCAAERLPFALVVMGKPELWQMAGYAAALAFLLFWFAKAKESGHASAVRGWILLTAFCVLAPCMLRVPSREGFEVTFVDVGQGDGICLQKGGKAILVDGGSTDVKELGKYRLEPFFRSRGITIIEHAFVSHADEDHISGLRYLLGKESSVKVKNLHLPLAAAEDEATLELAELAERADCPVKWMKAGDLCRMGELEILCIYPAAGDTFSDRNAGSLVLTASCGEFHVLLTGDTGQEQEAVMLGRERVKQELAKTDLLKAAHHGSGSSGSGDWLDEADPALAVISCGRKNRYGHPHEETLARLEARGIQIWRTDICGAVMVKSDGKRVRIRGYLPLDLNGSS